MTAPLLEESSFATLFPQYVAEPPFCAHHSAPCSVPGVLRMVYVYVDVCWCVGVVLV